jgi:hypothetical protein
MASWSESSNRIESLKFSRCRPVWQVFCSYETVENAGLTMTDLSLSQFGSLSKQELHRVLMHEKFEMHGSHSLRMASPPSRSFSERLRRLILSGLQSPLSLQRKFFRNFA